MFHHEDKKCDKTVATRKWVIFNFIDLIFVCWDFVRRNTILFIFVGRNLILWYCIKANCVDCNKTMKINLIKCQDALCFSLTIFDTNSKRIYTWNGIASIYRQIPIHLCSIDVNFSHNFMLCTLYSLRITQAQSERTIFDLHLCGLAHTLKRKLTSKMFHGLIASRKKYVNTFCTSLVTVWWIH